MTVQVGTRLGPYEILSAIGAGGMGEVYRATDTDLKREVAIKVLPESVAVAPDRLARFQREAEVLAALNHPNIAQIYGLEKSGGLVALVMELVKGEDLSARIARGPMPLDDTLNVARQTASALEAAHEQGIIHRDLKPANIRIRPDGTVKVLDFGLAKAIEPTAAISSSLSMSPTLTSPAFSQAGMIVGTAAYMSPEQAAGKPVDKRADIWAFGVVLWEMLTSRRLFDGETVSHTLADVLRAPIDFDSLPKATPRVIRELLQRCLDRNSSLRLRDIGEARVAIERYLAHPLDESPMSQQTIPSARSSKPVFVLAALSGALAIALAGAIYIAYRPSQPVDRPLMRFTDQLETGLNGGSVGPAVALSPDGSRLAYVTQDSSNTHIALRRLDDAKAVVLAGTDGGEAPFFSPDGRWVAFFARNLLKKVAIDGGAAATICPVTAVPRGGGFWTDDGMILFAGQRTEVLRVSSSGGTPSPVTHLDEKKGEVSHRAAQLLPGGESVLFEASKDNNAWEDATIEVVSLRTGERKVLVTGGYFGRYIHSADPFTGHLLYMHSGVLFAAPMDTQLLALTGSAVPVLEDVAGRANNGLAEIASTPSGMVVYVGGTKQESSSVYWLDASGNTQVIPMPPGQYAAPRISPDGSRLAVRILDPSGGFTVSIYEIAERRMTKLSAIKGIAGRVEWAPDGKHIVVALNSEPLGGPGIYWARADGAGEPRRIIDGPNFEPASFTRDGKRLAFFRVSPPQAGIWSVSLDLTDPEQPKSSKPELFLASSNISDSLSDPSFSPDGRWMAYASAESGRREIYVRPFPSSGGKWQVSTNGGIQPKWSPNGRELLYLQSQNALVNRMDLMVVAYALKGDAFAAGQPHAWSSKPFPPMPDPGVRPDFEVAGPDGKRIVGATRSDESTEEVGVTFLLNFADELKRRVPSK